MTVFKTFLKVLNKNKAIVILYSVILVAFGGLNFKNNDNNLNFIESKPDILIVNKDKEEGITEDLIRYVTKNSNIIDVEMDESKINDALFYRDVNFIIYIPENFREDFLNQKNPKIEVKSTGDYEASLASMILERYMKVANIYRNKIESEEELIASINETLSKEAKIEVTNKLDTESLANATLYYNFASYSMLAGSVYVIALILASFKEEKIAKRTIISSMDNTKHNRYLFLSSSLFAILLWLFYCILSFFLLGKTMFTTHGVVYLLNSFIFTLCALAIAILISNLIHNKNAINGIVNVVALGSSFLCGAFVPMEWLPDSVLKIAHILPSYYYIKSNELLANIEILNGNTLKPIMGNLFILILFIIFFVILTNIISKRKRKIG